MGAGREATSADVRKNFPTARFLKGKRVSLDWGIEGVLLGGAGRKDPSVRPGDFKKNRASPRPLYN